MRVRVGVAPDQRPHEAGANVRRTDRAHGRASWATRRSPSNVLAQHFGVSASRISHQQTDDRSGALTKVCVALADPAVDGAAMLAACCEAYEERHVFASTDELRARFKHLREVAEHRAEAEQNAALMTGAEFADECRQHASILLELACLAEILGLESDS